MTRREQGPDGADDTIPCTPDARSAASEGAPVREDEATRLVAPPASIAAGASPPASNAGSEPRSPDVSATLPLAGTTRPLGVRPLWLERVAPAIGRGERLALDPGRSRLTIGRAESNDLRLHTASASRQHAEIVAGEDGLWRITPCAGRTIAIDGEETSATVEIEEGMNLSLGGDRLRCTFEPRRTEASEGPMSDRADAEPPGLRPGPGRAGRLVLWLALGAVLLFGLVRGLAGSG